MLADASPLPAEKVSLNDALGCVLVEDVAALRTQPPAAVSAMDGYAVRGVDVAQAPVTLKLTGEVAAGHPFEGKVSAGQAARIFTGGVMPEGSDTVVIQELTTRDGDTVTIQKPTAKGRNVRAQGIDFAKGQVLLRKGQPPHRPRPDAGRRHEPSALKRAPPAESGGARHRRRTGGARSYARPGRDRLFQWFCADGDGAQRRRRGERSRHRPRPRRGHRGGGAARARWGADILVTSGGASVGEHDLVQRALAAEGLDLSFWKVALRPGRPMMHGRLGQLQVLGVPGNPVSSYVCAFLFLVPLIRRLAGRADVERTPEAARLGSDLPANDERADYLRATLEPGPDGPVATPVPTQDSSLMAHLAKADCLLIRAPNAPPAPAGSPCVILKLGL